MEKNYDDDTWLASTDASEMSHTPQRLDSYLGEPEPAIVTGLCDATGDDKKSSRFRRYLGGAAVLLVLLLIIVAISVGARSKGEQAAKQTSHSVEAPTPSGASLGPTPITAYKVADIIESSALFSGAEFDDLDSYQTKALNWALTQNLPAPEYPGLSLEEQARQLYALACIYFSTFRQPNGCTGNYFGEDTALPGWFSDDGWMWKAGEVCEWYGITCDDQRRVARLDLASNGLTGTFPPETQLLKDSLTYLDLSGNLIHNKGYEGNAWLGELTNLEYLYIASTSFENDGIPTEIGKLTKLKELDVSYVLYFGPLTEGMWAGLTDLSYLVMDGNGFNSSLPQDLISLPSLKYLYVADSFLEGSLDFIADMPTIAELWIDDNPGLSGLLPASVADSETLQSLSLTHCGLTGTIPTEFGLMTDMVQMWLYGNKLSGTIPTELAKIPTLVRLHLQENNLAGAMPEGLCNRRSPLGQLTELGADCDDDVVTCAETCCSCCGEQCIVEQG